MHGGGQKRGGRSLRCARVKACAAGDPLGETGGFCGGSAPVYGNAPVRTSLTCRKRPGINISQEENAYEETHRFSAAGIGDGTEPGTHHCLGSREPRRPGSGHRGKHHLRKIQRSRLGRHAGGQMGGPGSRVHYDGLHRLRPGKLFPDRGRQRLHHRDQRPDRRRRRSHFRLDGHPERLVHQCGLCRHQGRGQAVRRGCHPGHVHC